MHVVPADEPIHVVASVYFLAAFDIVFNELVPRRSGGNWVPGQVKIVSIRGEPRRLCRETQPFRNVTGLFSRPIFGETASRR